MFNEKSKIEIGDGKSHFVDLGEDKDKFHYYELNTENDISVENIKPSNNNGSSPSQPLFSHVTITPPHTAGENIDTGYFRIRINKMDKIFKSVNDNHFVIDGFFKKNWFVEVSINNVRKLSSDIVDKMPDNSSNLSMNLFLITDDSTNFTFQSKPLYSSRILESYIWNEYIGQTRVNEKVIAYHWKDEEFQDYNLFMKLTYIKRNWILLALMILFILITGVLGDCGGNALTKLFSDTPHEKFQVNSKNEKSGKNQSEKK